MEIRERDGNLLPATSLLLLAVAAVGVLWTRRAPHSFRPPQAGPVADAEVAQENVPARLWEDPLGAVRAHRRLFTDHQGHPVDDGDDHDLERMGILLRQRLERQPVRILVALVPGGVLSEDVEERLGTRYALVSALASRGFQPVRRDRIGYVFVPEESLDHACDAIAAAAYDAAAKEAGPAITVPFEWFEEDPLWRLRAGCSELAPRACGTEKRCDERGSVLVMWLDESQLGREPLGHVLAIRAKLAAGSQPRLETCVIGPSDSNGLMDMMRECIEGDDPLDLSVYDARTSVPEALLLARLDEAERGAERHPASVDSLAELFARRRVTYRRALCSDDVLLRLMLRELGLRGLFDGGDGERPRIALVTEFDTFYGRACSIALESVLVHLERAHGGRSNMLEALDECMQSCGSDALMTPALEVLRSDGGEALEPKRVEVVRIDYLRGLDGSQPVPEEPAGEHGGAPGEPAAQREFPAGPSQIDYVERHVSRLKRGLAGRGVARREVGAIAVLGSDLYDKQLVLQSMHDAYPGVPFFTTDLDARLSDRGQYPWSRNLIVASSYGFTAGAREQGAIPPFRSGYQSAAFVATRRALTPDAAWPATAPRVFEIARCGAHERATSPRSGTAASEIPLRPANWTWLLPLAGGLSLVLLLGTGYRWAVLLQAWRNTPSAGMRFVAGATAVLSFAALFGMPLYARGLAALPDGEPLELFDGISIWPTEGVRILAALACLGGLVYGGARLALDAERIETAFGLSACATRVRRLRLRERLAWSLGLGPSVGALEDGHVDAQSLWCFYRENGRLRPMLVRVGALAATYLALGFLLFGTLGGPHVPARGALARRADALVLFLAVASITVLLFYVIDATRECTRFVSALAAGTSRWPRHAAVGAEPGLDASEIDRRGLHEEDRARLVDVLVVAQRTQVVGDMVVLPFFGLALLVLSRLGLFDGWDWPPALVLVLSVQAVLALLSGFQLRRAAERARSAALERLNTTLVCLAGSKRRRDAARARQIEHLIQEIRELRRGAFAPWSQRPGLRAILMPFSGMGAVALLDLLSKGGG